MQYCKTYVIRHNLIERINFLQDTIVASNLMIVNIAWIISTEENKCGKNQEI